MPNVLAHNYVTHEVMRSNPPSANMAFGSVLPDFVHMYRDHYGEKLNLRNYKNQFKDTTLGQGLRMHYKIDNIFKYQPEVPKITTDLAAHLESAGIEPRAARLSAHFLGDVMVDGALLDNPKARGDFAVLTEYILYEETMLHSGKFSHKFANFVEGFFEKGIAAGYTDPQELARITKDRLDDRARRYADRDERIIRHSQLPTLEEIIDIHADRLHRLGLVALSRTIKLLGYQTDP